MYSREIESRKENLKLLGEQREVLVGVILGDGHLETQNKGRTYRLKIEQSIKHKDYVEHLYQIFRDWVNTPPKARLRTGKGGTENEMIGFQTYSHSTFRFYAQQFYPDGKKRIPKLINKWLTPKVLAYWFMDDGSLKWRLSRSVILNTQGYRQDEVKKLVLLLKAKFGLEAGIRKQQEGFQVCIHGQSLEEFVKLVGPYLLKEMWYKIPESGRTYLPKM
jgi:hypothetical protein